MDENYEKMAIDDLKSQWKRMWRECVDDKVRAEAIAEKDYSALFVERGTVIMATRAFKPLSFKEVLEQYSFPSLNRYVQSDPKTGGWRKFIRTSIAPLRLRSKRAQTSLPLDESQRQPKKRGRGWLHI